MTLSLKERKNRFLSTGPEYNTTTKTAIIDQITEKKKLFTGMYTKKKTRSLLCIVSIFTVIYYPDITKFINQIKMLIL